MRWASIDPGKKGGIAFWDWSVLLAACPLEQNGRHLYNQMGHYGIEQAIIEKVWGYKEQSCTTTFTQGAGCGFVHGISEILCGENLFLFAPATWKGQLDCKGYTKNDMVEWMNETWPLHVFPNEKPLLKKHDGLAEAIAIGMAALDMTPKKKESYRK